MAKVPETIRSRPPIERMHRVFQLIQQGEFPNCPRIAREFGVSVRTIKRDVEFLIERYRLPIAYDTRRYGFYFTEPVKEFPSVPMTEGEVFALFIAQKAVAQYRGTPFEQPLETAFQKLTLQLGTQAHYSLGNLDAALSFRPFAPGSIDLETFEAISRATQQQRIVTFSYRALAADKASTRRVQPYHVACVDNCWYLLGHDLGRNAMRTFALSRMRKVEVLTEPFTRPKDFNANDYLKGSFGIFKGGDDFEVVIQFDRWAADLVTERRWHWSQEIIHLPQGMGVELRMRLSSLTEVERWVLSWGTHATVKRPRKLAARLLQITKELAARYENPLEA